MRFKLANANNPGDREPSSATGLPLLDDSGVDSEPQFIFDREPLAEVERDGSLARPLYPFRVDGVETRTAKHAMSFLLRPWDQDQTERFSGDHGVLGRAPVGPAGEQLPWDLPTRTVFRPTPQQWDAGYVAFQQ